MQVEQRLLVKIRPKFKEMLVEAKAKSVEYELMVTLLIHFKEDKDLKALVLDRMKGFLDSKDPNRTDYFDCI